MAASTRYSVRPAYRWVCTDGRTASAHGALPYYTLAEADSWSLAHIGYTIADRVTGTVGVGRAPFATASKALAWIEAAEAREAAYAAALAG